MPHSSLFQKRMEGGADLLVGFPFTQSNANLASRASGATEAARRTGKVSLGLEITVYSA